MAKGQMRGNKEAKKPKKDKAKMPGGSGMGGVEGAVRAASPAAKPKK